MRIEDIKQFAHRVPFTPFRVKMNGGSVYDIPHPDYISFHPKSSLVVFYSATSVANVCTADFIESIELGDLMRVSS
jgi:hypothetical protein